MSKGWREWKVWGLSTEILQQENDQIMVYVDKLSTNQPFRQTVNQSTI